MSYVNVTDDVRVSGEGTDLEIRIRTTWYSVRKLIEKTMYIITKDKKSELLKLNYAQQDLFFEICKCLRDGKSCNFIILKARQLGFTTFISAFLMVMTFFRQNQEAVIIANTTDNASKIFQKYRFYYDSLKEHIPSVAPVLQNKTGNQLVTKSTHCSIRIAPATSDAVRGSTITGFHGSEVGFWSSIDEIIAAAKSAIPEKNINPVTFFFLESTANGENDFKDYWDDACENVGQSGSYIPKFYPWYDNPDYVLPYDGFVLTPFEKEQKEKYNLSLEQIAFFRSKFLGFKKNLQLTLQEYPFCPSDAFMTSGSGVFDNQAIRNAKDIVRNFKFKNAFFEYEVKTPSLDDFILSDIKLVESEAGHIKVYEKPQNGVPYVIGVDMAVGLNNDSSVAVVIRNDTKKVVAIMESNTMPQEKYSIEVVALGKFYKDALICPETAYGGTVISYLKKFNYSNIYQRYGDATNISDNYLSIYGFKTTFTSKQSAINVTREICSEQDTPYLNVTDYGILNQMESFIYDYQNSNDPNRVKMKGSGNKHDDRVMALAIAYYCSNQQRTDVEIEREPKQEKICWELRTDEDEEREVDNIWGSIYI